MNRKLLAIIFLVIVLIAGYIVFDSTKENVFLEVHGEQKKTQRMFISSVQSLIPMENL